MFMCGLTNYGGPIITIGDSISEDEMEYVYDEYFDDDEYYIDENSEESSY